LVKRIHNTHITIPFLYNALQSDQFKPKGLWYGINFSWLEWMRSEEPQWEGHLNYLLDIDFTHILQLDTVDKILQFSNEYKIEYKDCPHLSAKGSWMNWDLVASHYDGIEINPYQWSLRLELLWYYGWDVASGCIWNIEAIKEYRLIDLKEIESQKIIVNI